MAVKLGMRAKIYYGATADPVPELGTLTELARVRDVSNKNSAAEADATTRDSGGYESTVAAIKSVGADFEMPWNLGDAGFAAIKAAFDTGDTICLAILSAAREIVGADGIKGDFSVFNCSREEPLKGIVMAKITIKLTTFHENVLVTGS